MEEQSGLWVLGLPLLIGAAILGFYLRASWRNQRALSSLAAALNGRRNGNDIAVRHENAEFQCSYTPRSRNRAASFRILLPSASALTCTVTRKGAIARVAERTRLLRDLEVGDPSFDQRFLVRAHHPEEALPILRDEKIKELIRDLFEAGWTVADFNPGSLQLIRSPANLGEIDPDSLRKTYEAMRILAGALPLMPASEARRAFDTIESSSVPIFLAGLVILMLAAVFLWGLGWFLYAPVRPYHVFIWTLPVTAVLFLPIHFWMRHRLKDEMHKLGAGIHVVVWLFLTVAVHGAAMLANGALDGRPPEIHPELRVFQINTGKSPARVQVQCWAGEERRKINVKRAEAYRLTQNQPWRLTVAVKPGALGYEWVAWSKAE
jgi:hypothetical protein